MESLITILKGVLPTKVKQTLRSLHYLVRGCFGLRRKRPYSFGYHYQLRHMRNLPDNGVIVDIGSGHNPFSKATVLADRYLGKTVHRRAKLVLDGRPFVVLDIHHLPFKTKSIDYIYCSHVLEHTLAPEQVCSELARAGKAGYIETPTLMKDMLFSWAGEVSHKWYLTAFGNKLIFFEYDERRIKGLSSNHWQNSILSPFHHPDQDLFFPNLDVFNTIFEWVDHFEVLVFRLDQVHQLSLPDDVSV